MRKCVLGLIVAIALTSNVDAASVTELGSIPRTFTDWWNAITVPKFNPALGTLTGVRITLVGHVDGSARFESLDHSPSSTSVQLTADIRLFWPDNTSLLAAIAVASKSEVVDAFDGQIGFSGPSGRTYSDLAAADTVAYTGRPPSKGLGMFIGTGDLAFPASATGHAVVDGPGNIVSSFTTQAWGDIVVTYEYTAVPVPPAMWMGLPVLGGIVVLRYRRRAR